MSIFIGKQIERDILSTMQTFSFDRRVQIHQCQTSVYNPNLDGSIDCNNWHLDPSHPHNALGEALVCESTR